MGKTRRKYTREFKLSVIRELEAGTSVSELARKYNIHPALPGRWKNEYYDDPEKSFSGNGNTYKLENYYLSIQLKELHDLNSHIPVSYYLVSLVFFQNMDLSTTLLNTNIK